MLTFFVVTYIVTWSSWFAACITPAAGPRGLLFLLGTFAPGFVALWFTGRATGRSGVAVLSLCAGYFLLRMRKNTQLSREVAQSVATSPAHPALLYTLNGRPQNRVSSDEPDRLRRTVGRFQHTPMPESYSCLVSGER